MSAPNEPESPPPAAEPDTAPDGREGRAAHGEGKDPLRGSRTSGFWGAVLALVVVLLLLAIFILQNTQDVEVSFLGWRGQAPLSATLLIAAVAGAALVAAAGMLRILQLRRRVKRGRRS